MSEPAHALQAALDRPFEITLDGVSSPTPRNFSVENPATETTIARCPAVTREQLDAAVAGAREAQRHWREIPLDARRQVLRDMASLLVECADELGALITAEQGKPLAAARAECTTMGPASLQGFAEMDLRPELLADDADRRVELHRRPIGVVGAIIPWNYPIHTTMQKLAPALFAGNAAIVKPSPYTPLATLRAMERLRDVMPPGLVQTLAGDDELGAWMTAHSGIDKISFTGSTPTGRAVMASSATTLKRLTLELGGNDAGIVLPDTDAKQLAPMIVRSAFNNTGQVCHALKRLFVHSSQHDAMADALAEAADALRVGNGMNDGTELGPLANRMQFDIVCRLVDEARDRGGQVRCGGRPLEGPGYFYPPTIVGEAREGMALVDEEQFGPALPLLRYDEIDEAVERANASEQGLSGSVWTNDTALGERVAARLECGTAWVNQHSAQPTANHVLFPFGGVKASGIGRERGEVGLLEYTQTQVINRRKTADSPEPR